MSNEEILEKKAVTGVALDKHMMHVTISYPLPDNQLLTQLFTELEEGAVNVDMISQIVNLMDYNYPSRLKIVIFIKFL